MSTPCHICGYHPGSDLCSAGHNSPRKDRIIESLRAELERAKLQAEIDQRKIQAWKLAAEALYAIMDAPGSPQAERLEDAFSAVHRARETEAMAKAGGQ